MVNPILQMLNKPMNNIGNLVAMAKGNPQGMFDSMMQSNPQFRQFVNDNRGKSVEQIAKDYGVDLSTLNNLLK